MVSSMYPATVNLRLPGRRHGRRRVAGSAGRERSRVWVAAGSRPCPVTRAGTPVGFQNSATVIDLGFYAARSYLLIRPPSTGRRWIEAAADDEGIGITESDLERIFERFPQDKTGDRLVAGVSFGLGLYISRNLARKQGGEITARSRRTAAPACVSAGTPSAARARNQPWAGAIVPGSYHVHQPADPDRPEQDAELVKHLGPRRSAIAGGAAFPILCLHIPCCGLINDLPLQETAH
jgi:signal transduction histidine kinase